MTDRRGSAAGDEPGRGTAANDYFNAARCPVCWAPRTGMRCERCGISYADPRVSELGRALLHADSLRRALLTQRQPVTAPPPGVPNPPPSEQRPAASGPAGSGPAASAPTGSGPAGSGAALGSRPQSPSVGWLLLGVGALCLAVAAGIFIAVTWSALGWLERGAIMLGVTGVFATLTEITRRKLLRASTETLAAVTGVLWTATLIAGARLLPDSPWWLALTGLAMGGAAVAADRWHAKCQDRLWSVDALAALALLVLSGGLVDAAGEWWPIVAVLALVVGVATHLRWSIARLLLLQVTALALGILAGLVLTGQGLAALASGALVDGWRVLLIIAVLGLLIRISPMIPVRRGAAVLTGFLGSSALIATTARLPFDLVVWLVLAIAVPGVLAWLGAHGTDDLARGARLAGLGWLVPPAVMGLGLVLAGVVAMAQGPGAEGREQWWLLSTVGYVGLALTLVVVRTRRASRTLHVPDAAALLSAWTVCLVLVFGTFPIALAVLAPALVVFLVLARRGRTFVPLGCAVALAGGLCLLVVAGGWVAPAALLVVGLAALIWGYSQVPLRLGAQAVGWFTVPIALHLCTGPLGDAGLANANTVTLVAITALAALVLATHRWWWLDRPARLIAEIAGLSWAALAALLTLERSELPVTSLCLLLLGGALLTAGRAPDRRIYSWIAVGVLTLSSWALLLDRGASTLEWYTLPTALVLLALGTRTLRRNPTADSWRTLLPGLLLGLLPSLTLALTDPVSLRALLVGLCALALIVLGFFRHLAACFGTGAVVLPMLAVVELWPYVGYVPRWAGFAAAGVLLVAIGVRWEARLRDLRRVGGYLRGLR